MKEDYQKTCDNCQLFTFECCCIKFGYHADRCDPERDWIKKEEIDMNHTNATLFIRFGELPKDNKSTIWKGEECIGYEEGVSVYEAYKNSKGIYTPVLPMPKTNTTFDSYSYYLNHFRGHQYLVEGNIIGYGSDGEPLLKNVVIKETLK